MTPKRAAKPAMPRGAKKSAPPKSLAGAAGTNHKSPAAQAARDELDRSVLKLLGQKRNAQGLGKVEIATLLKNDATAVKASLNRLGRKNKVLARGATMNTVYLLPAAAAAASKAAA